MPDLVARPLSARALSDLLDRKPHLLRPLAEQLLPLTPSFDLAEHLGIDLNSIGRGEIAPAEGARIAERVRSRPAPRTGGAADSGNYLKSPSNAPLAGVGQT